MLRSSASLATLRIMRRIPVIKLKRWMLGLLITVVSAFIALIVWIASFDLDGFRPEIEAVATNALKRPVQIEGGLALTWRDWGVELQRVRIGEPQGLAGIPDLATITRVGVTLDPWAYLAEGKKRVRRISIEGAQVQIVQDADGKLNIDEWLANPSPKLQLPLQIDTLIVRDSAIHWTVVGPNPPATIHLARVQVKGIALDQPIAVKASVELQRGALRIPAQIETSLTLDVAGDRFVLKDLAIESDKPHSSIGAATLRAEQLIARRKGLGTTAQVVVMQARDVALGSLMATLKLSASRVTWHESRLEGEPLRIDFTSANGTPVKMEAEAVLTTWGFRDGAWFARPEVKIRGSQADANLAATAQANVQFHTGIVTIAELAATAAGVAGRASGGFHFDFATERPAEPVHRIRYDVAKQTTDAALAFALAVRNEHLGAHQVSGRLTATHATAIHATANHGPTVRVEWQGKLDNETAQVLWETTPNGPKLTGEVSRLDIARWQTQKTRATSHAAATPLLQGLTQTIHEAVTRTGAIRGRGTLRIGEVIDSGETPPRVIARKVQIDAE
jgi:hypothetical protein